MKRFLTGLYLIMDGMAVFLAIELAAWLKFYSGIFPQTHTAVAPRMVLVGAIASVPLWLLAFVLSGVYGRLHWDLSWTDELSGTFKPITLGMILLVLAVFMLDRTFTLGRWVLVIYYTLLLLLVFLSRAAARILERRMARAGRLRRRAIIFGVGAKAAKLHSYLERNRNLGYEVVGFIDPGVSPERAVPENRIIGVAEDLERLLSEMSTNELLVTIASSFHEDILALMLPATGAGVGVRVVPDLFDIVAGHVHSTQISGHPLMSLSAVRLQLWQRIVKTATDYFVSALCLALFLPLLIVVPVIIKIDSKGPVFYRQERVGKGGKRFRIIKFRSMVSDAEHQSGPIWASRDDPRVTRVGRVLRRTRIDEIPQFLNVLRNEMSLVGPRPERPSFVEELAGVHPFYPKRLTVKPGITGWAQVKRGYDTSMEDVAEKLKLDFYYLENQSLFLDFEILVRTVVVVLTGRGAH